MLKKSQPDFADLTEHVKQRIRLGMQNHADELTRFQRQVAAALKRHNLPREALPASPEGIAAAVGIADDRIESGSVTLREIGRAAERWAAANHQPAPAPSSDAESDRWPVLNDERRTITLPDGSVEALTPEQYRVVSRLIQAGGEWLNGDRLREYPTPGSAERPDHIINGRIHNGERRGGLPAAVRKHIEARRGQGYRWRAVCANSA